MFDHFLDVQQIASTRELTKRAHHILKANDIFEATKFQDSFF